MKNLIKHSILLAIILLNILQGKDMDNSTHCQALNPQEKKVIINKGTEQAFTGDYWDHHEDGTYTCKQCGTPLFKSDAKFDSGTGWPSFDDIIENNVKEIPDADGRRTEIVCAVCGGHLGHVFKGEGFTSKNTRHCVNSISLKFKKEEKQ